MANYKKFHDLWKKCVNGKFFWKKDINTTASFEEIRDYLAIASADVTMKERDYFVYADHAFAQTLVEGALAKGNYTSESLKDLFDLWSATSYHLVTAAGRQMKDTKKVYITKAREERFNLTDIAEDFTVNDIAISEPYTFYLESEPEKVYIFRRELKPGEVNENKYRWSLIGLQPRQGHDFTAQYFYTEGEDLTLAELLQKSRDAADYVRDSKLNFDALDQELLEMSYKMVPLMIKTFLYLRAAQVPPVNQHEEAIKIKQKNLPAKKRARLLKSAPDFIVYTLGTTTTSGSESKQGPRAGGTQRGHWVRGHFRKQRFGKNKAQTKIIYIEPFFKGDVDNQVDRITKI